MSEAEDSEAKDELLLRLLPPLLLRALQYWLPPLPFLLATLPLLLPVWRLAWPPLSMPVGLGGSAAARLREAKQPLGRRCRGAEALGESGGERGPTAAASTPLSLL